MGICEPAGSGRSHGGCLACPCQDPPIPRFPHRRLLKKASRRLLFWRASLSIELPLTAHDLIHPQVSSRPQSRRLQLPGRFHRDRETKSRFASRQEAGGPTRLAARGGSGPKTGAQACRCPGPGTGPTRPGRMGPGRREAKASWAVGGGQGAAGAALQRTRKLRGGPSRPASGPTLKVRRAWCQWRPVARKSHLHFTSQPPPHVAMCIRADSPVVRRSQCSAATSLLQSNRRRFCRTGPLDILAAACQAGRHRSTAPTVHITRSAVLQLLEQLLVPLLRHAHDHQPQPHRWRRGRARPAISHR